MILSKLVQWEQFGNQSWFKKLCGPIIIILSELELWFSYRFIPSHRYNVVYTDLPPRYYDVDDIMEAAMVKLLRRYIEDECGGPAKLRRANAALIEDSRGDEAKQNNTSEFLINQATNQERVWEIYVWFIDNLPVLENTHDMLMRKWVDAVKKTGHHFFGPDTSTNPLSPAEIEVTKAEGRKYHQKATKLRKQIDDTKDKMLVELVQLRRTMWT